MSQPYLGEIRIFAGDFAPRGWMYCAGQLLAIANNSGLFALIGTTYGGDGSVTFALPDLQGRVALHSGQGPGLSYYSLGQTGGEEKVALTAGTVAPHGHPVSVTDSGPTASPNGALLADATGGQTNGAVYGVDGATVTLAAQTVGLSAGSGAPHNNIQSSLALGYIIALEGVFPTRN